jgi:geranylgeranyl pyrophosphate synthase
MKIAMRDEAGLAGGSPALLETSAEPRTTSREARVRESLLERALGGPVRYVLDGGGKRFRAELLNVSYQLAGGRGDPPAFLARLIELLHAGSLVIDDIEDGSTQRRGAPALHAAVGLPLALNTGNFLYFWPLEQLGELGLSKGLELALYREYARTMCRAHRGQALDLSVRASELPQADASTIASAIAELKTGALTAFAARLGALAAHASRARVDALGEFGARLGTSLQCLDDVGSVSSERLRHKGLEDLRNDRMSHVWGFLSRHLDRYAYKRLGYRLRRADGGELEALRIELRSLLHEHGAREEIRRELHEALTVLQRRLELQSTALTRVSAEIERLEASYV